MKIISKLSVLFFIFFKAFSLVSAEGNCTQEFLIQTGMLFNEDQESSKRRLFRTSNSMGKVGMSLGANPTANKQKYFSQLKSLFNQNGLDAEDSCLMCFSESVRCAVNKCKFSCKDGPCKASCQSCIAENCLQKFKVCIGSENVQNPCNWESEYLGQVW